MSYITVYAVLILSHGVTERVLQQWLFVWCMSIVGCTYITRGMCIVAWHASDNAHAPSNVKASNNVHASSHMVLAS